jgi:hypothetical protein
MQCIIRSIHRFNASIQKYLGFSLKTGKLSPLFVNVKFDVFTDVNVKFNVVSASNAAQHKQTAWESGIVTALYRTSHAEESELCAAEHGNQPLFREQDITMPVATRQRRYGRDSEQFSAAGNRTQILRSSP